MSFEALKAEIGLLLGEMENQPQDARELFERVREKINEMRAYGMPIPDDLAYLEQTLEQQFMAAGSVEGTDEGAGEGTGEGPGAGEIADEGDA